MSGHPQGEPNGCPPRYQPATIDALVRVLADQTRRNVVRYLRERSEATATFEDIAQHVAAVSAADRDPERVTLVLYHEILPKLECVGVIEYDVRSETVRYRGHAAVADLLDCVDSMERESMPDRSSTDS